MSDGPWKKEEAEPISWVVEWTDENIEELINLQNGFYGAQAPGQPLDPSPDEFAANTSGPSIGIGVSFCVLVLCGLIALTSLAGVPTPVVLIEMGVVAAVALLVMLVLMPRWQRKQRAQVAEVVQKLEPATVTLSAEGVSTGNSTTSSSWAWAAIIGSFRAKTGVGLWFEGGGGMILPRTSLPAGIDEAELVRRIDLWRGNA